MWGVILSGIRYVVDHHPIRAPDRAAILRLDQQQGRVVLRGTIASVGHTLALRLGAHQRDPGLNAKGMQTIQDLEE